MNLSQEYPLFLSTPRFPAPSRQKPNPAEIKGFQEFLRLLLLQAHIHSEPLYDIVQRNLSAVTNPSPQQSRRTPLLPIIFNFITAPEARLKSSHYWASVGLDELSVAMKNRLDRSTQTDSSNSSSKTHHRNCRSNCPNKTLPECPKRECAVWSVLQQHLNLKLNPEIFLPGTPGYYEAGGEFERTDPVTSGVIAKWRRGRPVPPGCVRPSPVAESAPDADRRRKVIDRDLQILQILTEGINRFSAEFLLLDSWTKQFIVEG